jgi:RNA polymerase sigma-70 factor (sigma-E family)
MPSGAGDFESFFREVFPRAVALARRVTGDQSAAEDAALEALAKAHFRWRKLAAAPWRESWVLRVTVNESIRRLPRARDLQPILEINDPTDAVVLRHTLTEALRALPRRQREVIVLRYLVGLREPEVAEALGISHGTVKTHLRRGLSALRGSVGHAPKEEHVARLA